jgi:hypothetical protein
MVRVVWFVVMIRPNQNQTNNHKKVIRSVCVELKEKCFLVHVNNYFVTGEQRAAVYWRGTYACQNTGCATYVFSISSLDEDNDSRVFFDCQVTGLVNHIALLRPNHERIYGNLLIYSELLLLFTTRKCEFTNYSIFYTYLLRQLDYTIRNLFCFIILF